MPRIAAAISVLVAAAFSIGFNVARYPIVSEMVVSPETSAPSIEPARPVAAESGGGPSFDAAWADSPEACNKTANAGRITASIPAGTASRRGGSYSYDDESRWRSGDESYDTWDYESSYGSPQSDSQSHAYDDYDSYSNGESETYSYDDSNSDSYDNSDSYSYNSDSYSYDDSDPYSYDDTNSDDYDDYESDSHGGYDSYSSSHDDSYSNRRFSSNAYGAYAADTADEDARYAEKPTRSSDRTSQSTVRRGKNVKKPDAMVRGPGGGAGNAWNAAKSVEDQDEPEYGYGHAWGSEPRSTVRRLPAADDWTPSPRADDRPRPGPPIAGYPSTGVE